MFLLTLFLRVSVALGADLFGSGDVGCLEQHALLFPESRFEAIDDALGNPKYIFPLALNMNLAEQ